MTVTWSCGRWSRQIKLAKPESYSVDFFYFSAGWPLWPDPLPGRRALLQTHRKHQKQGHPIQAAAVQQISLPATSTSLAQCSCQLNPLSDRAAAKSKPVLLTTELQTAKANKTEDDHAFHTFWQTRAVVLAQSNYKSIDEITVSQQIQVVLPVGHVGCTFSPSHSTKTCAQAVSYTTIHIKETGTGEKYTFPSPPPVWLHPIAWKLLLVLKTHENTQWVPADILII